MKAESIGDDQRVGRHSEGLRLRQTERGQFRRIDAKRPLPILGIRRMSGGKAHAALPGEPRIREPVGPGNVGEGSSIVGDIGEEEPCLYRRVEGIGVQEGLRIGGAGMSVAQDALHPDHRLGVAAPGVANQPAPVARPQHRVKGRQLGQSPRVERDLAHERVALGDFPQRAAISPHLSDQRCELMRRQKIRPDDKTVSIERRPVLSRY